MALDAKEEVEHILREELRKRELLRVEARRPLLFLGFGGEINRGLTLSYLSHCDTELDKALLRGALTGALWTAARAHEWGLRPTRTCPYCDKRVTEDEEHPLWRCPAWAAARESNITEVMLLAKALRIGSLSNWPKLPETMRNTPGQGGAGEQYGRGCTLAQTMPGTRQGAEAQVSTPTGGCGGPTPRRGPTRGSRREMGGARHAPLGALHPQAA